MQWLEKFSQNITTELDEYDWHEELHSGKELEKKFKRKKNNCLPNTKTYAKGEKYIYIYWSDVLGTLIKLISSKILEH